MTNPMILMLLFAITAVVAFLCRRKIKAAWEGPELEVWGVRIPTEDPINDRIEIFFSKERTSDTLD